ncbi:hypothetical protein H2203_004629 [Taxawa tesnikishii (nom. ined.)]|nr:hypothetical protein H2203_004629 [Dothideales sp. JES 119]
MALHIRKRQIQPNKITSYFERADGSRDGPAPAPPASRLSPVLPESVQTSLINVGMRVRKSVPEGYKTHKTLGLTDASEDIATAQMPSKTYTYGRSRELAPFCGLHEIGGLAAQPPSSLETPGLTFSQDSLISTTSTNSAPISTAPPINNKKRNYDEEIEEELDSYFANPNQPASNPSSRPASPFSRLIAKPRTNRTRAAAHLQVPMIAESSPGDFDDADVGFLQPMEVE